MNRKFQYLFALPILLSACGYSAGEISDIVSERDSLRLVASSQARRISNLDEIVNIVNGSLDSIATEEGNLFVAGTIEGGPVSKQDVLRNLERLETLIASQKSRIANLEERIMSEPTSDNSPKEDSGITSLLKSLREQLDKKDAQIATLKNELAKKDVDLARLKVQTEQQSRTIVELDRRSNMQQEALKRQDAMLNQCYMVMASKKELENRGIIKKGKVVAQSALDRSKFSKVDIRKLTEVTFTAKKPRILTPMPESSYELTTDGNKNFTLKIINPTAFWSMSNYLIIQTN